MRARFALIATLAIFAAVAMAGWGGGIASPNLKLKWADNSPNAVTVDSSQFLRTAHDVADSIRVQGRVPGTVWLGSMGVTPEAYLAALAKVVTTVMEGKDIPTEMELTPTKLVCAKHVANDDDRLWGWVIFPPNFRAPAMMDLAKRQAWTLKPALLHGPRK